MADRKTTPNVTLMVIFDGRTKPGALCNTKGHNLRAIESVNQAKHNRAHQPPTNGSKRNHSSQLAINLKNLPRAPRAREELDTNSLFLAVLGVNLVSATETGRSKLFHWDLEAGTPPRCDHRVTATREQARSK
ncbi:hypothetical protein ZHAS_00018965 [Anopheles sinensis]|uniref:Uncharacterized protein n=1 Tax=Anopheles sinensis TaxID=74873 RepID=A0A084WL34_ANOSI|nr:hypothetical protein ZHAS_00018965 [Anopheles sinensis]